MWFSNCREEDNANYSCTWFKDDGSSLPYSLGRLAGAGPAVPRGKVELLSHTLGRHLAGCDLEARSLGSTCPTPGKCPCQSAAGPPGAQRLVVALVLSSKAVSSAPGPVPQGRGQGLGWGREGLFGVSLGMCSIDLEEKFGYRLALSVEL